jgi:alpha-L-arabinofuranosidase
VADKSVLTVAVVNPTDQPASTALAIKGAQLTGQGMMWVIAGTSRTAHNDPGMPREVDIRQEPYRGTGELRVPPLSVAVFELKVR